MSIEQEFIDWINEHPDDNTTQMVYADWLDEQGDPRAEGWRVLLEAGKRPFFSTEFIENKFSFSDWNWWGSELRRTSNSELPRSCYLPDYLVNPPPNSTQWWWRKFPTFHSAMDAAATAWVRFRRDPEFMREQILG